MWFSMLMFSCGLLSLSRSSCRQEARCAIVANLARWQAALDAHVQHPNICAVRSACAASYIVLSSTYLHTPLVLRKSVSRTWDMLPNMMLSWDVSSKSRVEAWATAQRVRQAGNLSPVVCLGDYESCALQFTQVPHVCANQQLSCVLTCL